MSANYPKTPGSQGHDDAGFFGDHILVEDGGSGSADANAFGALPMQTAFGGRPRMPSVGQTLHGPTNPMGPLAFPSYSYNGNHGISRPWSSTEPLNINKRINSQRPPPTVDSHNSAVESRSASSIGSGGGSFPNGYHDPGSSGEALLSRGNTGRTSITEPKPILRLDGRGRCSSPPTAFVSRRDSGLEYGTKRIQQHQEEQKQQDRADKSISQIILARLRASRTPSTVKAYSQCTTLTSEESAPSRAPSYVYSPSLSNPHISLPQTLLPRGVTGGSYATPNQRPHHRQGVGDTSEGLLWHGATLPHAPSPAPTDTSSMVEGLLHPRLGMVLAQSQQASATSLRDHEDYTRPINGVSLFFTLSFFGGLADI